MNTLVLLTNFFPYGNEEPYLETELPFYKEQFDQVIICSLQLRDKHTADTSRQIDPSYTVLRVKKLSLPEYLIRSLAVLADRQFYSEICRLGRLKMLSAKRLTRLGFYLCRAHYEASFISKRIGTLLKKNDKNNIVYYSYRFEYQPYVGLLLKKKFGGKNVVSRAHGFDLYEELRPEKYIPLRPFLLSHLSKVFTVATESRTYLLNKYPGFGETVEVGRLGTTDKGISPTPENNNPIRIISVSTLSEVKRVDKIIESLSLIKDREVIWDHFGDGILRKPLSDLCLKMLGTNIRYTFYGHINNQDLIRHYTKTPYHYFVNVSSSEGIPVSIMEAMSFGIPCIATNVGGTGEIVKDSVNGYLLDANFSSKSLAQLLIETTNECGMTYMFMRQKARSDWNREYNALNNYRIFTEKLRIMSESSISNTLEERLPIKSRMKTVYPYIKRGLDIVFSAFLSILLIPIAFLVGILIVIEDGFPIFYKSTRMGKEGKIFNMLKFRSMYNNSPDIRNYDGSTYNATNDPRVTKIGKILRMTSIDELPQILNVLTGDMSFIGPRPSLTTTPYGNYNQVRKKRVSIRPGITGYSQAYYRNSISQDEKFKYDCKYVDRMSLTLDIKILVKTITSIISSKNIFNK